MAGYCEKIKCEVLGKFNNGKAALQYLTRGDNYQKVDFILTDLDMPIMDGITMGK